MCGIAGVVSLDGRQAVDPRAVAAMTATLTHRGPDAAGQYVTPEVGLGMRRLRIIDLATGDQPLFNEDHSLALVCNGEIFNYRELRSRLVARGHRFTSQTDVEVVLHLYEELGDRLVEELNGQFAFALYDRSRRRVLFARDPFGVNPLHYAVAAGQLLFGSEIKAILAHPAAPRGVDLVGLDQVLSFPGTVSPRTVFAGVSSLPPGHRLIVEGGELRCEKYWDLDYPPAGPADAATDPAAEAAAVEELREVLRRSVERRLLADVPLGFYLSGGLDSTLVASLARGLSSEDRKSFSIGFADPEIDESAFQQLAARALGTTHHAIAIDDESILARLRQMVWHCESPVKETFNTCALALAEAARAAGVTVVLAGEGADELFGGYPGYRFDARGATASDAGDPVEAALEAELRERLWGDRDLFYEKNQIALREVKQALYSPAVRERFDETDCLNYPLVDRSQLAGRHVLHQRSFLDFKLRLADHLLSEHGDRMAMAQSIEARYPFLDVEVVALARRLPPGLKVNGLVDKHVVRRAAEGLVPERVLRREKHGFRAPGLAQLLRRGTPWVEELLSPACTRHWGFFSPEVVSHLRQRYAEPGFRLHPHLETDLLMIVLTFHLLCEQFALPPLS